MPSMCSASKFSGSAAIKLAVKALCLEEVPLVLRVERQIPQPPSNVPRERTMHNNDAPAPAAGPEAHYTVGPRLFDSGRDAMDSGRIEQQKQRARAWFETLRDRIVSAFEALEDALPAGAPLAERAPAASSARPGTDRSHRRPRRRRRDGDDERPRLRKSRRPRLHRVRRIRAGIPQGNSGAADDPRFFATGISLIAHLHNPHVPAVHMNTRYVVTTKSWFGGGADLTPVLDRRRTQDDPDTIAFHAAMKDACDAHAARRALRQVQDLVRRVFLSQAPRRDARHRRHFLRLARQRRLRRRLRLHPGRRPRLSRKSIPNWCGGISPSLGTRPSARSNSSAAAATSNSICSTIAAPFSACAPAAMSSRSCPRCRRW